MKENEETEIRQTKVIDLLASMRNGQVLIDIDDKFNELLEAVLDTGAKGRFTLELVIEPAKKGMGGVVLEVTTEHECKIKKPELKIGSSMFYVGNDRALSRDDPDQSKMFENPGVEAHVRNRRSE